MHRENRRKFIRGAVVAPIALSMKETLASSMVPLDMNTLKSIAVAANGIYANPSNVAAYAAMHDAMATVTSLIQGFGLDQLIVANVPQNTSHAVPYSLGYVDMFGINNWLGISPGYFAVNQRAEPSKQQIMITHKTTLNYALTLGFVSNFYAVMGSKSPSPAQDRRLIWGPSGPRLIRVQSPAVPKPNKPMVPEGVVKFSKQQADIALATGGGLIGGGTVLTNISGITYATLAEASVGSIVLFSLGSAAIVIGLGVAGYYGYQFLSQYSSNEPVSSTSLTNYYPTEGDDYR